MDMQEWFKHNQEFEELEEQSNMLQINSDITIQKHNNDNFIIVKITNYTHDIVQKDLFKVFFIGDLDSDFSITKIMNNHDEMLDTTTGNGRKITQIVKTFLD